MKREKIYIYIDQKQDACIIITLVRFVLLRVCVVITYDMSIEKKGKREETEEEKNRWEIIIKKRRCDGNANERGKRREIRDVFAFIVCV